MAQAAIVAAGGWAQLPAPPRATKLMHTSKVTYYWFCQHSSSQWSCGWAVLFDQKQSLTKHVRQAKRCGLAQTIAGQKLHFPDFQVLSRCMLQSFTVQD